MRIIHGRQLTAARALAELTVVQLAAAAGVTSRTVHRLEIGGAMPISPTKRSGHVGQETVDRIRAAFAAHGVELTPDGEKHGAGARWRSPHKGK